ncbi:MAG: flagellar basal body rod C-terminal domain-containing protein [bacterium]|nr:flagellar basal body rod C-terminal domain-containing protein [bacterium]
MIDGLHTAYQGMVANGKKMQSSAHDISRAGTGETVKSPAAEPDRGVEAATQSRPPNTGDLAFQPVEGATQAQSLDIDLGKAVVDLIGAQRGFEANTAAFRAEDETVGTLLDIVA